jgi:hypothetical protein
MDLYDPLEDFIPQPTPPHQAISVIDDYKEPSNFGTHVGGTQLRELYQWEKFTKSVGSNLLISMGYVPVSIYK